MKSFIKKGINILSFGMKGTSHSCVDDIVMPAHDTNACWMNSYLSAVSNLLDPKTTETLREACVLQGRKAMAKILTDIYELRQGKRDKFSRETKKSLGYNGHQNDPLHADLKFKELGGKHWPVSIAIARNIDGNQCLNTMKENPGSAITILLSTKNEGQKSIFDHLYALHVYNKNGTRQYLVANDKGNLTNYNASLTSVSKEEAERIILERGCGYVSAEINEKEWEIFVNPINVTQDSTQEWVVMNNNTIDESEQKNGNKNTNITVTDEETDEDDF